MDNERLLCQLLVEALGAPSYKIYTAHSAAAALRAVTFSNPALVLLDLCLPDENGLTLCRKLQALPRLPQTYCHQLSAVDYVGIKGLCGQAQAVIEKPYVLHELHLVVQKQLNI
ncbi:MAG: response regulator [Caldilineaceae bacterium]